MGSGSHWEVKIDMDGGRRELVAQKDPRIYIRGKKETVRELESALAP